MNPIGIHSVGVATVAGHRLHQFLSAYENRKRYFSREKNLVGHDGFPPILAAVFPIWEFQGYVRRLRALFDLAFEDCLRNMEVRFRRGRTYELYLVLPEWLEKQALLRQQLTQSFTNETPKQIAKTHLVFGGHAGGLGVISGLNLSQSDCVFVAGLDSYIDINVLDALTLFSGSLTADNPYGFIPGEAACVLFLTNDVNAKLTGTFLGATKSRELQNPFNPDGAILGRGIIGCLQKLAASLDSAVVDRVITDMNGARYRAEEFGVSVAAMGDRYGESIQNPEIPSANFGDVGAASGALFVALALGPKPKARVISEKDQAILIVNSCVYGNRAAAVIKRTARQNAKESHANLR
jgi:hypothetical protein